VDWLNSFDGEAKRIFELGMLVDIQAKLSEYKGQKQISADLIGNHLHLHPTPRLHILSLSILSKSHCAFHG